MATQPKSKDDVGQAEVQSERDKAREQGFEGTSAKPIPNSEYTLQSGPDSPSAVDAAVAIAEQRLRELKGA